MHLANKRGRAVANVHRTSRPTVAAYAPGFRNPHLESPAKTVNSSRVLLFPATPEVSVNADHTCKLIQLRLSKPQLGIKIIGLIG